MKKNSNSYVLIKSLTMSEKRYFKIFSERHTIGAQNKYVALFDELDKIENENDSEIKRNLKAQGINADFISADKNYLYQLILRSLNEFHNSKTFNLQVKDLLLSIEILFHKGLYHESLKLINKAELLADECENFQLMIDILTWKKKCSGYSLGLKKAAEANLQIDKYITLLNNLKRTTDLYYESNLLQTENEKYTYADIQKKYAEILNQPELKSEKNVLSFSAKIFYHLIYSNYYVAVEDKRKEYDHLQKLVDVLNASKTYAAENPLDYISIYNRLLSIKKFFPSNAFFDDIKVLNNFAKEVTIRKEVVLQRVFVHTNTHELEYYLINNRFRQALAKTTSIDKEHYKLSMDMEPYHMIYFFYLQAVTLVYLGQFHKSLKIVNKSLQDFTFDARPQVYLRLELLNVIIHYELKNYTLVKSLAKQVLKKNSVTRIFSTTEENILAVFIKIVSLKHSTQKEELVYWQKLMQTINGSKDKLFINILNENYVKWVSAKIKRKLVCDLYE
jgi:hypothetical protein